MSRAEDLRADFVALGVALENCEPAAMAAIARERRLIGATLELLEKSGEVSLVDELAVKRAGSKPAGIPARRRKSG